MTTRDDDFLNAPKVPVLTNLGGGGSTSPRKTRKQRNDLLDKYLYKSCNLMGLVDATGSMDRVWDSTKKQLTEALSRISKMDEHAYKIRWVAYRDYSDGDGLLEYSGWETEAQKILPFIGNIQCYGGDDWEEAIEKGLEFASQDNEVNCILLIGDAPPHQQGDYLAQARKLASQGKTVYGFVVGDDVDTFKTFSKISNITGGSCTWLNSADDILDLIPLIFAHFSGGSKLLNDYSKKYKLSSTGSKLRLQLLENSGG